MIVYEGTIKCDNEWAKDDIVKGLINAGFVVWCEKTVNDNSTEYEIYYLNRKEMFKRFDK